MEWLLIGAGVSFVIGYFIGKPKDEAIFGGIISLILGPIGWIIVAVSSGNMRKCPFCAEEIKREARVCRYCGRDVPRAASKAVPPPRASEKYEFPRR